MTRKKEVEYLLWLYHISKINWDASVDKVRKRVGFGIIARDHDELVLEVWNMSLK
jgi:hypothetical protein